jgi:hypothetical protein
MTDNKPQFYVGDVVTVVDRGDERFVVTKLPAYSGGSYTIKGAYDDTLEVFIRAEGMTLYKASPFRPVQANVESKRAERERIDALLDAKSSFAALYDTLPDGAMRELIGELRDEAEKKLREMAE